MGSLIESYKQMQEVNQITGDSSMPSSGPTQDICSGCKKTMKKCSCEMSEELKGKQKKLDKNHNGKLDGQDFKILRKESTNDDVPFDGPYTTTFKKTKNPNRTGMDAARALSRKFLQKSKQTPVIAGHEGYSSEPDKLKTQHFGKQVKEEVLDEANHRDFASAGMMHPDMAKHMNVGDHMDYYEPKTGDKVHGKVMHKSDGEVHMKQTHDSYNPKKVGSIHRFKVSSSLPDQEMKEEVDLTEATADQLGDTIDNAKSTEHAKQIISKAQTKHLQYLHHWNMGLSGARTHKDMPHIHAELKKRGAILSNSESSKRFDEEVEQVQEVLTVSSGVSKWISDFVHSTNPKFKGKSVKQRQQMALGAFYAAKKGVKEDYSWIYDGKQLDESGQNVAPTVHTANYSWGKMKTVHQGHDFSIPLHPEHHEAIAKLEDQQEHKFKDETGKHWSAKRVGTNVHFQGANGGNSTTVSHSSMKEETEMKTFRDFITEMEFVNGRYVHKGKYGTSYDDPEGKEDSEKPAAEKAEKRGRGRPAGAKSGARQLGGASKKGSGVEYTGYKLHLPNSNKSY